MEIQAQEAEILLEDGIYEIVAGRRWLIVRGKQMTTYAEGPTDLTLLLNANPDLPWRGPVSGERRVPRDPESWRVRNRVRFPGEKAGAHLRIPLMDPETAQARTWELVDRILSERNGGVEESRMAV